MSEQSRIRVVLADDHTVVREGLKLLIDGEPDMVVVAEAADGNAAVEHAISLQPDVVVLDISMPGMNGLLAARTLKKRAPAIAIVTLTRHTDDGYLQELLRSGVSAYVLKQSAGRELLHAIRTAVSGGQYIDSTLARRLTSSFSGKDGGKSRKAGAITDREADVLRLIARGYSNKEIANELSLSVKTVEAHKANAMRKLDLSGRVDIVNYAVLQGWLDTA